jgi:thiamine biosynthesis lipoprotein
MQTFYRLGAAGLGVTAALAAPAAAEAHTWRWHGDHVLGTSLDLAAVAERPLAAALAIDAVRSEIARLDAVLSGWRADSELMRLNRACELVVSDDLFAVIAACERWRGLTGGAYSARLGRLLHGCNDAALSAGIAAARVGLDPATRTIYRPDNVMFAIDGLAKGYIIDRALAAAKTVPGLQGMMVDIGGDLKCWGTPPGGDGWRVGLITPARTADNALPASHLLLGKQAAATSGISSRRQAMLCPQTGRAVEHIAYATVVADDAADADALATAFSVMAPEQSLRLADDLPGVAARILTRDGQSFASARWEEFRTPRLWQIQASQPNAPWPAGFSLDIEYEVPKVETSAYHNPYVAIWITDENRQLVKTLLALGRETRWREENYIYWRRFGRNDVKLVDSVTRPTRAPGRYNLAWDGVGDDGKKAPQGKYVLNIEASREKGGHTVQRVELTLGPDGVTVEGKADGEVGRTRVSFGRKL